MTSPVVPPGQARPITRRDASSIARRLVALTPLWILLVTFVARGAYWVSFFGPQHEILGIPRSVAMIGLAMVWMVLGLVLTWDARSRLTQAVALLVFTIPATLFLVLGPAIVLIVQNLG